MRLTFASILLGAMVVVSAVAQDIDATAPTLASVAERLSQPEVLRGHFSQTRHIPLLSRPLESSGQFILSDMGLYWRQESPFVATLMADGERLVQRVANGPAAGVDSVEHAMVLPFSKIFLSLFRGDEDALAEHFSVAFETSDRGWEIHLTPTSYPLSEAIDGIILRGREHIDQLDVLGRSSDEMIITFHDLETRPEYLTEHEMALYAW